LVLGHLQYDLNVSELLMTLYASADQLQVRLDPRGIHLELINGGVMPKNSVDFLARLKGTPENGMPPIGRIRKRVELLRQPLSVLHQRQESSHPGPLFLFTFRSLVKPPNQALPKS
jgi:hypothetical protein